MSIPKIANGPVVEVDFPDPTVDAETETLLELAEPERKEVGGQVSLPFSSRSAPKKSPIG